MPEPLGIRQPAGTLERLRRRVNPSLAVRILLTDGGDSRVRRAARALLELGFKVHLVGRPEAGDPDPDLALCWLDPEADPEPRLRQAQWAERLDAVARAQGRNGMRSGMPPDGWRDPITYGALRLALGEEDAMLGGSTRPTAEILRAALRVVGLRATGGLLSASCLMVLPDGREYLFADVSVTPDPDADRLVGIAADTAATWQVLTGQAPRVAFLSFSTHGSAAHERVDRVRLAAGRFREWCPDILSDGELQLDAAIVPEIAARKAPGSPLAGRANVLIFPSLESGNLTYKAVERMAGARAVGMILQGAAKPIHDLSRGASPEDIVAMALVAAAQARALGNVREGEAR